MALSVRANTLPGQGQTPEIQTATWDELISLPTQKGSHNRPSWGESLAHQLAHLRPPGEFVTLVIRLHGRANRP